MVVDAWQAWRPPKELTQGFGENYRRLRSTELFRGEQAAALLAMTPFVRRAPPERLAAMRELAAADGLQTTVDVILSTHRVWLGAGDCGG